MKYRYYIKKLTSNELGYRKGRLVTGQFFYISKQATDFFPALSPKVNNDTVILEFIVEYRSESVWLNLVYHNDKFNRTDGTRDEYRIYLNRDAAPDDFIFRPDDIIVMERKTDNKYKLSLYRTGNEEYDSLCQIIKKSKIRGHHALTNDI